MEDKNLTRDEKVVVLYSGGLDSTVLLYWCKERFKEVYPLYVNYNSSHKEYEFDAAQRTCKELGLKLQMVDVNADIFKGSALSDVNQSMPTDLKDTINVVVPFRNLMFMTLGAAYADAVNAGNIATSPTKEDFEVFRDCRRDFYDAVEATLSLGAKYSFAYSILTPFINDTKSEVIQKGIKMDVNFENTWTCYSPQEGKPCGTCPSCQVRSKGFQEANLIDPLVG